MTETIDMCNYQTKCKPFWSMTLRLIKQPLVSTSVLVALVIHITPRRRVVSHTKDSHIFVNICSSWELISIPKRIITSNFWRKMVDNQMLPLELITPFTTLTLELKSSQMLSTSFLNSSRTLFSTKMRSREKCKPSIANTGWECQMVRSPLTRWSTQASSIQNRSLTGSQ